MEVFTLFLLSTKIPCYLYIFNAFFFFFLFNHCYTMYMYFMILKKNRFTLAAFIEIAILFPLD